MYLWSRWNSSTATLMLFISTVARRFSADRRALPDTGIRIDARIATIAITTRISISVKPRRQVPNSVFMLNPGF